MTIKTRRPPTAASGPEIIGTGPFVMAMTAEQLELLGSLLFLVKGGQSPYQAAAMELCDNLEVLSCDVDFCLYSYESVMPTIEIRDVDTLDVIAIYDNNTGDHIVEIIV